MIDIYIANPDSSHSTKWFDLLRKIGLQPIWINKNDNQKSLVKLPHLINKPIFALILYLRLFRIASAASSGIRIHLQYIGYNSLPLVFLPFRFKLISTVWGSDILLNTSNNTKRLIVNRILTLSNVITVDSMHLIPVLLDQKVCERKIRFVPFGTDTNLFKMRHITSSSLQFSEINPCRFLSLRQLYSVYAVNEIIQAFSIFITHYYIEHGAIPFACLDIYATGDQEHKLRALTSSLNLDSMISFKGRYSYSELPDILSIYHYSISASHSDAGLSASIAESMACGVVPIVNDYGDNMYWVTKEMGLSFKTASVESLAQCLLQGYSIDYKEFLLYASNSRSQVVDRLSNTTQEVLLRQIL